MPPADVSASTSTAAAAAAAPSRSHQNSNAVHSVLDVLISVQERRTETLQNMQAEHDSTAKWLQETIQVRT